MRSRVMRRSVDLLDADLRAVDLAPRRPARGRRPRASNASPASVRGPSSCGSAAPVGLVEVVDRHRARDQRRVCSSTRSSSFDGRSYSSSISPTISSSTSCSVTIPAVPPYSSTTTAIGWRCLAQLAQQRAEVLGHRHDRRLARELADGRLAARRAGRGSARRRRGGRATRARPGSGRAASRPRTSSASSRVSAASSQTTSGAGTITSRTSREAKSNTLCSSSSWARGITPEPSASSTSARSSSAAADRVARHHLGDPERPQQQRARALQHPHDRPQHLRHQLDRPRHQRRQRLRAVERQRLRHELAEDDAQVGHDRERDHEPRPARQPVADHDRGSPARRRHR